MTFELGGHIKSKKKGGKQPKGGKRPSIKKKKEKRSTSFQEGNLLRSKVSKVLTHSGQTTV